MPRRYHGKWFQMWYIMVLYFDILYIIILNDTIFMRHCIYIILCSVSYNVQKARYYHSTMSKNHDSIMVLCTVLLVLFNSSSKLKKSLKTTLVVEDRDPLQLSVVTSVICFYRPHKTILWKIGCNLVEKRKSFSYCS